MERALIVADELVKRDVPSSRLWADPVTEGSTAIDFLSPTSPVYIVIAMDIADADPVDDEKTDRIPADDKETGNDVDGRFGPRTRVAVAQFHAAAGLETDGRVGPITYEALGLPHS